MPARSLRRRFLLFARFSWRLGGHRPGNRRFVLRFALLFVEVREGCAEADADRRLGDEDRDRQKAGASRLLLLFLFGLLAGVVFGVNRLKGVSAS